MNRIARLLLAPMLLSLPAAAMAQIYVCKDASGRTITSDRPIAECANQPMRELDRNGVTRRQIPAPLTAQQRRERDALEEKQRIEAVALEERRLYDRALTTRYRNEADIDLSRKRAIELLDDQMRIDTNALTRESKELKLAQALPPDSAKPAAVAAARKRLEDAMRVVESRLSSIEQRKADMDRTHLKFDAALKRFRELQALAEENAAKAAAR